MSSFVRYQLPAILFAVAIFMVSSIPSAAPPIRFQLSDKFYHFIEYGLFGYLCARAFRYQGNRTLRDFALIIALVVGSLYAILDEFHQSFIPGRYAEVGDFIADVIGVSVSVLIFGQRHRIGAWIRRIRSRKRTVSDLRYENQLGREQSGPVRPELSDVVNKNGSK